MDRLSVFDVSCQDCCPDLQLSKSLQHFQYSLVTGADKIMQSSVVFVFSRVIAAFETCHNQVRRSSDYRAHMRYAPSTDEQQTYSPDGLAGDVVLEYDVMHTRDGSYTEVKKN